jgi:hypothetical protein
MYDCLGRVIIIKVYSHQLTSDFRITVPGNTPSPNSFSVSANQIADNAASYVYPIGVSLLKVGLPTKEQ